MPKVLIIEDRRENIVFIANSILKPMGYEVITAMDGQTGLEKAMSEKPDLIITDLKLPRMGGLEMLEHLLKNGYDIPSIVMTFHGTEETARRALRVGARDYLIKPFTIEEMQTALDRALKGGSSGFPDGVTRLEHLEQELSQARTTLAEREDQLKRLSTASQMAARVPQLERELARLRAILAQQADEASHPPASNDHEARIASLEQQLVETQTKLATREKQLRQMQKYLATVVKKTDLAAAAQEAAAWKEENARVNEALAKTKKMLLAAQQRVTVLENIILKQKTELAKYRQQTRNFANELRNLSEAVRLLSQDLHHQTEKLDHLSARED